MEWFPFLYYIKIEIDCCGVLLNAAIIFVTHSTLVVMFLKNFNFLGQSSRWFIMYLISSFFVLICQLDLLFFYQCHGWNTSMLGRKSTSKASIRVASSLDAINVAMSPPEIQEIQVDALIKEYFKAQQCTKPK